MSEWTRIGEYLYRGEEQIAHFADWRIAALAARAFELDAERRETDAEIERLRAALSESYQDELYSAYHAGLKSPEKNEWRSGGMSNAEWLCRLAGIEVNKPTEAKKLFDSIPTIAIKMVAELNQQSTQEPK